MLPGVGPRAVARRIPNRVIGDRISVVCRQLVFPPAGAVCVVYRLNCRIGCCFICFIGMHCLGQDVPAKVIAVDDGLVQIQVVLPDQLIYAVIVILLSLRSSFCYGLDVAQRVIGVVQRF